VSQNTKEKIWNMGYIDLAILLFLMKWKIASVLIMVVWLSGKCTKLLKLNTLKT
jgi:hypothetical protein